MISVIQGYKSFEIKREVLWKLKTAAGIDIGGGYRLVFGRVLMHPEKSDHLGGDMFGKKTLKKTVEKAVKKVVKKATKVEKKVAKKVVKKVTAVKKTVGKKTSSAVKAVKKKIGR